MFTLLCVEEHRILPEQEVYLTGKDISSDASAGKEDEASLWRRLLYRNSKVLFFIAGGMGKA